MSFEDNHGYEYKPRPRETRKEKYVDPSGRTAMAERAQRTERARKRRSEKIESILRSDLDSFPKSNDTNEDPKIAYLNWLRQHPSPKDLTLEEDEIRYEQSLAGGHGGQNVQKTATSFVAIHRVTGIRAKSEDERSAFSNKLSAKEELEKRLRTHLSLWEELTKIRRQRNLPTDPGTVLPNLLPA